jgi:DNA-binding NtrC family response regulator
MSGVSSTGGFACLILEDDPAFAGLLAAEVRDAGGRATLCASLGEARERIAAERFDLACLDNRLPDGTGYVFHAELSRRQPDCVALMITGMPELAQAVALTRNGLFDYLTKPLDRVELRACLGRALERLACPATVAGDDALVGDSSTLREALQLLRQAARHATATVLLLGETGTGKDLAARLLHQWTVAGGAGAAEYVALNCPAVPSEMFEAELFGSERGAYTGADRRRIGLVAAAEGGTLFLDEVSEIPLALQAKLLRFLESREYRPLGGTQTLHYTGRVVAATNRDLGQEVRAGRFREDLLYRLDVTTIRLPALRERFEDLPALITVLLDRLCRKYDRQRVQISPGDLALLSSHAFPGNVRELRNLLERALLRAPDDAAWLRMDPAWLPSATAAATSVAAAPASATAAAGQPSALSPIEAQEHALIQRVLAEEQGAIRRTAARLGITHQALLRRLQKWPDLRPGKPASS